MESERSIERKIFDHAIISVFFVWTSVKETKDKSLEEMSIKKSNCRKKKLEIGGGDTVLVVEDDLIFLEIVSFMLTPLGFAMLEAKDGVDAVEVFE